MKSVRAAYCTDKNPTATSEFSMINALFGFARQGRRDVWVDGGRVQEVEDGKRKRTTTA